MKADDLLFETEIREFSENSHDALTLIKSNLTVRDYIAIKALQGLLSNPSMDAKPESYIHDAYLYADALIAESEKKCKP